MKNLARIIWMSSWTRLQVAFAERGEYTEARRVQTQTNRLSPTSCGQKLGKHPKEFRGNIHLSFVIHSSLVTCTKMALSSVSLLPIKSIGISSSSSSSSLRTLLAFQSPSRTSPIVCRLGTQNDCPGKGKSILLLLIYVSSMFLAPIKIEIAMEDFFFL